MTSRDKDEFGLGPKELSILFPFHFIFNTNLMVLQVGPSSSEIFGITKGSSLSDHIKIKLPDITPSFSKISQLTDKNFLLESTRNSLILNGQMLLLENQEAIAFLGSPWITESEQFYKSGLKMTHFAIHFPVMDYIFMLQAQKMSLDDANMMAMKNQSISQKLEQANNELKNHSQTLEGKVNNRTEELVRLNQDLQDEINQRKQAEGELKSSNQALNEFAAIASHDLKAPLRKIISFGSLLAEGNTHFEKRELDYLDRIQNSAYRMQKFIDHLLDYARISSSDKQFTSTSLNQVIQDVISDLEVDIKKSGGRIEVEELPTLWADKWEINQLFQNLISNSLKFQSKDIPAVIKIGCRKADDNFWEISIEDNGIGFDHDHANKIFKPFARLHGTSTYEGTGIGLATCKKVVEHHRGSITAKSSPGMGATFIILLPDLSRSR